ncbi:hypothetical protein [Streptomyces cucumeris]|uniref:hypothetical protein n=1 Tax=Streptomyces cucumeris TaxID=2962890 RepID=UPI0020C8B6FD|nr:hypothetical protein [Streptomyces sp. NEAU-Y11]MCP9209621.1 hypothetical protein [Streptomyces sp. NEAU-Y11]
MGSEYADDDQALIEALRRQPRPALPGTIEAMRELIEELMTPGLIQRGLSAPEARVEATRMLAGLEQKARTQERQSGQDGPGV